MIIFINKINSRVPILVCENESCILPQSNMATVRVVVCLSLALAALYGVGSAEKKAKGPLITDVVSAW